MMRILFLAGTGAAAVIASFVYSARGHDAVSGWSYPFACCSNQDCREIADERVSETPSGYLVDGRETVPYSDARVRTSPDGRIHWCTVAGENTGRTICLFVPPRSF